MSDALIGRTEELRLAIADLTGPSPSRIFVDGVPGVGKTAFLRAVLDDPTVVARFGSRRFYVTTAGAATADAFVMRVSVALDETQPSMVHGVVVERLSQQPTLLAIDDADVASHADALGFDELMSRLTKIAGLSLVVAARGRMTSFSARWTRILTLKPLHHDHARELLIRNAGGAITRDDQIEQLLNHAGQLPLAVELFGRALGSGIDASRILGTVPTADTAATPAQSATSRVVSCLLDAPEGATNARVIALLARLPDGLPPELLNSLGSATQGRIAGLVKAGLVTMQERATLRVSSAETVKAAAALDPADSRIVEAFYLDLVIRTADRIGKQGGGEVARRLSAEARNLEWAIDTALARDGSARAIEAAFAFGNFMRYSGHGSLELLERARDAARARGDQRTEANLMRRLGDVARNRSALDEAMSSFRVARAIYQRIDDVAGVAACIRNQAGIAQERQRWDEAAGLYREAATLYRNIGNDKGEAVCVERLGEMAFSNARFDEADFLLRTAQKMYENTRDLRGQGNCLQTLGDIASERKEWNEAEALLQRAHDIHKEIGNAPGIADARFSIGRLKLGRNDPSAAKACFDEALASYRSLGNVPGEANSIAGLADCLAAAGDLAGARERYEVAITLYRRVGDVPGEACAIKSLADLAHRSGSDGDAKRLFYESLPLYLQVQDPVAIGEIHQTLAEIESNPAERRRHLEAALEAFRHTERPDRIQAISGQLAGLDTSASS